MKKMVFVAALTVPLLTIAGYLISVNTKSKEPMITFYKVPLVCNAAPGIGCGSRSKPVLLKLESNPAVKEAWLNRSGTVVAIVWRGRVQTESVAGPIFNDNNLNYTPLTGKSASPYQKTFREKNLWYRGDEVDQLSEQEASVIAASYVKLSRQQQLITQQEADKIEPAVAAYFRKELVRVRTIQQLTFDDRHTFKEALYRITEKYAGKKCAEKAVTSYYESCQKNQCHPSGCKDECC